MDQATIEAAIGPLKKWSHQCHAASLAVVKSGVLGEPARVARGSCPGVAGQHSWVVLGNDCYVYDAIVIDPTLWSYDDRVDGLWVGNADERPHRPHGAGDIFDWGKPTSYGGEAIKLRPARALSADAKRFLRMLGPLDRRGWMELASHAPVEGWPAGEILTAVENTPELAALVPVDRIGMLTDLNPGGLYF
ncbi:MAG: hypothetical protein ABIQ39_05915 [Ilumatobacteraceae bacterium]